MSSRRRPVVVLTRDAAIRYLSYVTIAPISSTIHGSPSEVILDVDDGMKNPCAVNLHAAATVPQKHLGRLVAQFTPDRMSQICEALRFSLGCDLSGE